jgi:hypothetical protein
LLKARGTNIGVALWAVIALLAFSVQPLAHAHARESGATLVHSHLVHDDGDHGSTLNHGDHHAAKTLSPTFVPQSRVEVMAPPAPLIALITPVVAAISSRCSWQDETLIHGPPIRPQSLRAPPA